MTQTVGVIVICFNNSLDISGIVRVTAVYHCINLAITKFVSVLLVLYVNPVALFELKIIDSNEHISPSI